MPGRIETVLQPPQPEVKKWRWRVLEDGKPLGEGEADSKDLAQAEQRKVLDKLYGSQSADSPPPRTFGASTPRSPLKSGD